MAKYGGRKEERERISQDKGGKSIVSVLVKEAAFVKRDPLR